MQSETKANSKPNTRIRRRPWLAALLSLFGGPIGQIYVGRIRRSLTLWCVGAVILLFVCFACIALRPERFVFLAIVAPMVLFPIYLAIDAYVLATIERNAELKRYQKWWIYTLAFVIFAAANQGVAHAIRWRLCEAFTIPGRAMSPTIVNGDRVLVDKLWSRPETLRRNDVVVFRSDGPDSPLFVMRIVALPGDQIEIIEDRVLLNGREWTDPHGQIDQTIPITLQSNYGPIQVPPDAFFVLGDNRRRAADSRVLGPIPFSDFCGKALLIYWSREQRVASWDPTQFESGPIAWSRIGKRLD